MRKTYPILLPALVSLLNGCETGTQLAVPETPLIQRGRAAYTTYCQACHNIDPRRPGAVGPEVAFASLPLLEARILRADYPEGYTPKRPGKVMPAMPQLKNELASLHAYLNALKP